MAKTGCDKDCSTCDLSNRTFCATQLGIKNQEILLQSLATNNRTNELLESLIKILTPLFSQNEEPISPIPGGENKEKVPEDKKQK